MPLLDGVIVLDLSHTLAGPFATMVLADLGATVIKVEPLWGDETRGWAPFKDKLSAYYASINRGKKSIAVDLTKPEGREVVYRIASRASIVFENYRRGVREKLGVDPETLFKINPRLVYVSIKGFAEGSRYEGKPAYDIVIQALSGLMAYTGEEGRPPVRVAFALFDVITGLLAALAGVSALYAGRKPAYIEVTMYEAALYAMCYLPAIYLIAGVEPKRMGSAHPSIVPYQAFQGSDGSWFVVAAANDQLFKRLVEALGLNKLLEDPRYRTNADRVKHREELVRVLEEVFSKKPTSYWVKLLESHGVPVAPVQRFPEIYSRDELERLTISVEHPEAGSIRLPKPPVSVNGRVEYSRLHPPLLGEHAEEILEWLGYSSGEARRLMESGVVCCPRGRG